MNKLLKSISIVVITLIAWSCEDADKNPFPDFQNGASFRAVPSPYTTRPSLSLSSIANASVNYSVTSYNADELEKVDVYVSHLTTAQTTSVGPLPAAAATPVTVNYVNYNNLITGATPAVRRFLFKSLTTFEGNEVFSAVDLAAVTGVSLNTLAANQSFVLIFEATRKDGKVFSYVNSGPGINGNPAPSAGEGADFIPGVIIRVIP